MTTGKKWIFAAMFLVVALVPALRSNAADDSRHFALLRSEPAADSTVVAPSEVRLWFTEAPQDGSTQIRLLTAEGTLVPSSEAMALPDESTVFGTTVEGNLPPGRYTVAWRAIAMDGHAVSEQFEFAVSVED